MAEMDTSSKGGGHKKGPGVKKSKKLSTRVDLTPMVDLGFLLITFFIFTTTMAQPNAVNLNLPADGDSTKASASKTHSLILGKDNEVYYYHGQLTNHLSKTSYNAAGLRRLVDSSMQVIQHQFGSRTQINVLIKATQASNYQNI